MYSLVKKRSGRGALVIATLLAVAAPAHADRALSLDDTLRLAKENNRDLKAAKESLAQIQVAVEQTRAQLLPTVAVQGKYTFNYPDATLDPASFTAATTGLAEALKSVSTGPQLLAIQGFEQALASQSQGSIVIVKKNQLNFAANASVPLIVPGAYPAYQAALAQRRATLANIDVTATQILFAAAAGFYAAAGADELCMARKHAIDVTTETVKNAKARLEAGVVNRVEVTRAELANNQAVQQLTQAEDTREQAYRALGTLIQLREAFVVQPPTRAPSATPVTALQKDALSLRPEFRAYELNLVAQQKQVQSGWLRWLPTVSGFAGFQAFNYAGFSGKEYGFAAGVQADWVLYDGGLRDAARHQAESQRRQLELSAQQLHDTINDDIANADRAIHTRRDALATAEHAVALSKETLGLVRAQHDAGTATQLDLLQAQDSLTSAEAAVAQARFDLALGELTLQRTAGTFPPGRGSQDR